MKSLSPINKYSVRGRKGKVGAHVATVVRIGHLCPNPRGLVLNLRLRRRKLVEPGKCSVDVCLVEDFAASDFASFDCVETCHLPLGVKALPRDSVRSMGDKRPQIVQPMDGFDVDGGLRCELP